MSKALPKKLPLEHCLNLSREVSEEEIRQAFFSMKDNKAPGPDGFSAGFLKKAWSIVGNLVVSAVKSLFSSGKLLREVNSTAIALIPKVPNPTSLRDYRPISCCNTIYKGIAKIIANRVKASLPLLVGRQQTAFVEGRRIGDNILLAQELMINYHRDKGSPRCALKVDLMKAFDTVRWDFLLTVLRIVGFPETIVRWIEECITTPKFSISLNGNSMATLLGARGRQFADRFCE